MKKWISQTRIASKAIARNSARALLCVGLSSLFVTTAEAGTLAADAQTMIEPQAALSNTQSLNFGKIVSGTNSSVFVINANSGVMTRSSGNGVAAGGTVSRAHFHINAPIGLLVLIGGSTPSTITLTRSGGTQTMTVTNLTLDAGGTIRTVLTSGTLDYNYGGQLNVPANAVSGHYQGTFTVTATFL